MKKIILSAILFAGCAGASFAQSELPSGMATKKEKQFDQYVGVQINGLIRQVFNFNNTTTNTNTNPYLVTYNINSKKSGWGLRAGVGLNMGKSSTNSGSVARTSDINDMQIRLGIEKAFDLSDKWSAGVGLDAAYNSNDDKTTSKTLSFDTVTTDTKTKVTSYGGGAMAWLRYSLTKHVIIGTEASFYYMSGKQTSDVHITETFSGGGGGQDSSNSTEDKLSSGTFNLPVVFYLLVKF